MQDLLVKLIEDHQKDTSKGRVANYIPELSKARSEALGISIYDVNGRLYQAGDVDEKFTIQSISKPISKIVLRKPWRFISNSVRLRSHPRNWLI